MGDRGCGGEDPTWRSPDVLDQADGSERTLLRKMLEALPPVASYGCIEMHAPVIILPDVLDAALCTRLIAEYERDGGQPSGFMDEVDVRRGAERGMEVTMVKKVSRNGASAQDDASA